MEEINVLEKKAGELRYRALPNLLFLIGIFAGIVFSLFADILGEKWRNNIIYELVVSIFAFILLIVTFYIVHFVYIKPINKIENEIKHIQSKKVQK